MFEALHHGMRICNPMTGTNLGDTIAVVAPRDGDTVLDIACGHGELLVRLAERWSIDGIGVDRSPWVLVRAAKGAALRSLRGSLTWWLGDAAGLASDRTWDVVTCLGASWIWDGFAGTVEAMAARTKPGGRIAFGELQLNDGGDAAVDAEAYGVVLTREDQLAVLERHGIEPIAEIVTTRDSWDDYDQRTEASADAYAVRYPGEEAERFRCEQKEWRMQHDDDKRYLSWTVWVGRKA